MPRTNVQCKQQGLHVLLAEIRKCFCEFCDSNGESHSK